MRGGNKPAWPAGRDKTKKEFDEMMLEVRRVTRVTTWGRRMSFRATVLVGNRKWKIWLGVSKWPDVSIAVQKASREAYKNMFDVPLTKAFTVPYPTVTKYKSCFVKLIPAAGGTGLKAWSSIRSVLELAGYENVLSKMVGSNNKLNNAMATIMALCNYKHADHFAKMCNERKNVRSEEDSEEIQKKERPEETKKPEEKKEPKFEKKIINNKTIEVEVVAPVVKAAPVAKPVVKKVPVKK